MPSVGNGSGSGSATGIRDSFKFENSIVKDINAGSYTVPAGKRFYVTAMRVSVNTSSGLTLRATSGSVVRSLLQQSGSNVDSFAICQTAPLGDDTSGFNLAQWGWGNTTGWFSTFNMSSSVGTVQVDQPYIHSFPAGTVIDRTIQVGSGLAYIAGYLVDI
jgi:hypothetical protein